MLIYYIRTRDVLASVKCSDQSTAVNCSLGPDNVSIGLLFSEFSDATLNTVSPRHHWYNNKDEYSSHILIPARHQNLWVDDHSSGSSIRSSSGVLHWRDMEIHGSIGSHRASSTHQRTRTCKRVTLSEITTPQNRIAVEG